jgi:hypothetical protein
MADVMVLQLLRNSIFLGMACTSLIAIPEYVRWAKAGPASKSPWFWMAREDDHSTPQRASQSTDNYISTLLQKAPGVTITVPTTITTTSKTTPTSYIPPTTLTELKTITLYRTNTRTFYQLPSTSTVTKHTEITTTSKIRPTFTETVTEITAPAQTVYIDSPLSSGHISGLLMIIRPLCLAIIAAVAYGAYKYGVSVTRKGIGGNRIETERKQRERENDHDQMLEDCKNFELEKEKAGQDKAQMKKDSEARVAQVSIDLEEHKVMLGRSKTAIKDLDDFEVTDAQLRDDETFGLGLRRWKIKRGEVTEAIRGYWRTKKHQLKHQLDQADLEIGRLKERVKQMENILTKVGNETNLAFRSTTFDSAVRDELYTQEDTIAKLRAHMLAVNQQNDELRERNAALQTRYERTEGREKRREAISAVQCLER